MICKMLPIQLSRFWNTRVGFQWAQGKVKPIFYVDESNTTFKLYAL